MTYRVASLDDIEQVPGPGTLTWLPVRHTLGIRAFGTNAYMAEREGEHVVEPHSEAEHEELYFVARGRARFTLDGEDVDAPAGTYVFLPEPATHREAVAVEPGTTVLSFGAPVGKPFEVSGWEPRFRANAIRERDPAAAKALLEEGLAATPHSPWAHYDLACWHALYGSPSDARAALARAVELGGPDVARQAAGDPDLSTLASAATAGSAADSGSAP
jgi:quercetin dioxygenase-like cupin family protein